ncbi:hypothetical protein CMQ_1945 [Grosmannia clavigera kw1407]|uniref:gamma-glutamylcyclotransferase n=1 Tax=Grosmannia clavigera (strain kw1407 / UAMH 11150) TaxID=655863 RepID=F0XMW9_GROCL|nr:uncharacterized protein CMQ_1945 [Grosmannia clavigera kw1407]EFX00864.1 hypothetical protein CMQ_1945 [Grosmannia clavigera kw1407]
MLYFAFGSNLSLQQMSKRCPQSRFIGRAILPDYRWQINQRGYANVVQCCGSSVHGLVYLLEAADEVSLDRSEGVGIGAYSKDYCDVLLYPAAVELQKQPDQVRSAIDGDQQGAHPPEQRPHLQENTLVYLSTHYIKPGAPHEEYIHRINTGIRDAVSLGVPPAFFENAVRPLVPSELEG